ncbi:MAG: LytTR family DNA-binding domain-containing protein, partial [Bacteroidota bacterium]
VAAIDYILKPFKPDRFNQAVTRVVKKPPVNTHQLIDFFRNQLTKEMKFIQIPEGNKDHLFKPNEILYIQSDRYYVQIHTPTDKRLVRASLKKLEALLPDHFLRINKSTIINFYSISQIEYLKSSSKIWLTTHLELSVSSLYNEKFKRFIKYHK